MPVTFSQIEVSIQVSAKMVTTHEESGSFGVGHTRNVVAPTTLAVAGAALWLSNPCGISGVAKPVAQQDRRSAPPDGRDRI